MAFLSNLFGSNDTETASAANGDIWGDLDAVVSIDFSNEVTTETVDDDGSSSSSHYANDFGTDIDVGALLGGVAEFAGMSNGSGSGGYEADVQG